MDLFCTIEDFCCTSREWFHSNYTSPNIGSIKMFLLSSDLYLKIKEFDSVHNALFSLFDCDRNAFIVEVKTYNLNFPKIF